MFISFGEIAFFEWMWIELSFLFLSIKNICGNIITCDTHSQTNIKFTFPWIRANFIEIVETKIEYFFHEIHNPLIFTFCFSLQITIYWVRTKPKPQYLYFNEKHYTTLYSIAYWNHEPRVTNAKFLNFPLCVLKPSKLKLTWSVFAIVFVTKVHGRCLYDTPWMIFNNSLE